MKKTASVLLSLALLAPSLVTMSGCASQKTVTLRVYNWTEYIDEGGEGSYDYDYAEDGEEPDTRHIIEKFEEWYKETYDKDVRVEYSTFGTNEDLYNQLKLGDKYDLVCPSDYMIMKFAEEGMIEPLPESFFDEENEYNYYIQNVSPFIKNIFENGKMKVKDQTELVSWGNYAAGYMWGVTGITYNPEKVSEDYLKEKGWEILLDPEYKNVITTKDNVRDCYFVGLGIEYQKEMLALKEQNNAGILGDKEYTATLTEIMNRTDPASVEAVTKVLKEMKENIFGFETDTGKSDMIKGTISMNFAWSGDAVYAMDEAEEDEVYLNYFIPDEGANLFFDGWVMPKDDKRDEETKKAALAFINYLSLPDNAVRNSYYIGYTSVIAGDEMFEYVADTYGVETDESGNPVEDSTLYDVSYFFGEDGDYTFYAPVEQLNRQLLAQYPDKNTLKRCVVMDYYGAKTDEIINEMWTQVKGATLDAWAIIVLCVAVVAIACGVLFVKFGSKIEFRLPAQKGYRLVRQEKLK